MYIYRYHIDRGLYASTHTCVLVLFAGVLALSCVGVHAFCDLLGTQLSGAHERKEGGWQWVGGREREREREREKEHNWGGRSGRDILRC